VWSTGGTSKAVTVSVRVARVRNVAPPRYTVCPSTSGETCSLGNLPAGQADELQAGSLVAKAATGGEQVDLTASASGRDARSFAASGSVVVAAKPSPSPTPTTTTPEATSTLPPVTIPTGGTTTGTPPAGLFPTISPSPSSSDGVGFPPVRRQGHHRTRVATDAAILPLDPRLIGGQLAGLAVLAGAIAIAIARLSLRKPRPQSGPASKDGKP
jgi:hypothetical protein